MAEGSLDFAVLYTQAEALSTSGSHQEAIALCGKIITQAGDRATIGHALALLGNIERGRGRYRAAIQHYVAAIRLCGRSPYLRGLANRWLARLAYAHWLGGNYQKAVKLNDLGVRWSRELNDGTQEAWHLVNKGTCLAETGQAQAAIICYERAANISDAPFVAVGTESGIIACLNDLACYAEALERGKRFLDKFGPMLLPGMRFRILNELACASLRSGGVQASSPYLKEAGELSRAVRDPAEVARYSALKAAALGFSGAPRAAADLLVEARNRFQVLGLVYQIKKVDGLIAEMAQLRRKRTAS